MTFDLKRGDAPVILTVPHAGTSVPEEIADSLNDEGRSLRDTDWHVDRLYRDLLPNATMLVARVHRYVVDLNRDPSGQSLYPGQNTTGIVPATNFDGAPIWRAGHEPGPDEIARRVATYHRPYHEALAAEIERLRGIHGAVLVYDCHSIRSHIPFLFEGRLPDFNLGTDGGTTCAQSLEEMAVETVRSADGFSYVLNGRFKGGWTVRHHGRPPRNIHALQMELAQSTHLASETPPFDFDETKGGILRKHLGNLLQRLERATLATITTPEEQS